MRPNSNHCRDDLYFDYGTIARLSTWFCGKIQVKEEIWNAEVITDTTPYDLHVKYRTDSGGGGGKFWLIATGI